MSISRFGVAAVAVGLLGCGRPGGAPTLPASGTVTYKGAPATDVQVLFQPKVGRPAMGFTDDEGRFTLTTFKPDDGAVPGVHKAAITDRQRKWNPDPRAAPPPSRFPERYQSVVATPWEFEVKEGSDNDFKLEMVD